jgi:hypothetical protein
LFEIQEAKTDTKKSVSKKRCKNPSRPAAAVFANGWPVVMDEKTVAE